MTDPAQAFRRVLEELLEVDGAALGDDAGPSTLKKWNSMTHMKLVARLEETFSVRFKVRDVVRAKCVADLKALLAGQGVQLS